MHFYLVIRNRVQTRFRNDFVYFIVIAALHVTKQLILNGVKQGLKPIPFILGMESNGTALHAFTSLYWSSAQARHSSESGISRNTAPP